jgi:ketosteroid isomerase-like protein
LERESLREWIEAYERAWRDEGTAAVRELFTEDAFYSTAPFEQPHLGVDAIVRMWEAERSSDEAFTMESEVVAVEGDTGVARIEVAYERPSPQRYRDLWVIRLGEDGRCFHFEEWPFWPPGTEGTTAQGARG